MEKITFKALQAAITEVVTADPAMAPMLMAIIREAAPATGGRMPSDYREPGLPTLSHIKLMAVTLWDNQAKIKARKALRGAGKAAKATDNPFGLTFEVYAQEEGDDLPEGFTIRSHMRAHRCSAELWTRDEFDKRLRRMRLKSDAAEAWRAEMAALSLEIPETWLRGPIRGARGYVAGQFFALEFTDGQPGRLIISNGSQNGQLDGWVTKQCNMSGLPKHAIGQIRFRYAKTQFGKDKWQTTTEFM